MKNLLRIVLIVTVMASLTTEAKAQNKFGHINSTELLQQMPERDSAEQQLAAYAKTLETRMLTMQNEYRTKLAEYEEKQGTWSDLIKEEAANEIRTLEGRIQEFQSKAQSDLQKRESELLEPILEKARNAITKVAQDNGFTYVFDSGVGVLLHQPDSDNILPLVKKELGLP